MASSVSSPRSLSCAAARPLVRPLQAHRLTLVAAALLTGSIGALAQTSAGASTGASASAGADQRSSDASTALPQVTVRGSNGQSSLTVGGFGDTPVAKLPMQASVLTSDQLADRGLRALSGLTAVDASVGDSYNSSGYVSYLKIRGYDLDNRFNYRRDGLPINAETAINLSNKSSLEVLKGTSGMQAGTSAPGGLVNLVVKRPTVELTTVTRGVSDRGTT